jgi:DNA-binding response OmpR family regulator
MERMLSRDGHDITCAFDGPAAIRHVDIERPDVVLLDITLGPPFDGIEVYRRLPRGLPVIIVSGLTSEEIRSRAVESVNALAGAVSILGKPIDYDALRNMLALLAGRAPTLLPDSDDEPPTTP